MFEFQKVMVVSTRHMTSNDIKVLESKEYYAQDMYGFFLWASSQNDEISPALRQVLKTAKNNECQYVRLDASGPIYECFEQFDW